MQQPIITAQHLTKAFGTGQNQRRILDDVSVEIHTGEFVAIMGPSGCGKSTLLFALSGLDPADSGDLTFEGRQLANIPPKQLSDLRRQRMGFVFQQPTMLKNLSIRDNIILPALRDHRQDRAAITARLTELLEQTGISHIAHNQITQASGGELQRAGICRALINSPAMVFGDEPTGALNSQSTKDILQLFDTIHAQGTTILIVTHDARVAAHAQRTLFMRDGHIVSHYQRPTSTDHAAAAKAIIQKMETIGI